MNKEVKKTKTPLIALVGRVNVGKSTLFNLCIEEKKAVTAPFPGTTRDVNEGVCKWQGRSFLLADTGGFVLHPQTDIEREVARHAQATIKKADGVLFVVDAKEGPHSDDHAYLKTIRKLSRAPLLFVLNKADKQHHKHEVYNKEWLSFGLGAPFAVSAATGGGSGDLLDAIFERCFPIKQHEEEEKSALKVAIIGRTNVGKSSLLNSILGQERVIVSPTAHTTREPQDTLIEVDGVPVVLIDTVGIRKKSKMSSRLERDGVERSMKAIKSADVVILVLEATLTASKQECRLAGVAEETGAGLLLAVNKWDLIEQKEVKTVLGFEAYFKNFFSFVSWAPFLFLSALTGKRVNRVLRDVFTVQRERERRVEQNDLDVFIARALARQKPIWQKGKKRPVIHGLRQTEVNPPTFSLLVESRPSIQYAYLRYLENRLRAQFGFQGTPLRIHTEEKGKEPLVKKKNRKKIL